MPPWVHRQWHVLGVSRSSANTLCRIQWRPTPACVSALRWYAQQSTLNAPKTPEHNTLSSAILIPSSVSASPEDLISHIYPISKKCYTKDQFAVFLLTPAFATCLLDDQFIHKALGQLYQRVLNHPKLKIHALCAVVDKLPTPQCIERFEAIQDVGAIQDTVLRRIRDPPIWDTGHEGVAYAALHFSYSVPSSQSTTDKEGSISFLTSEGSGKDNFYVDTLRVPLANTIFQTGSPTTMTYSIWEKVKEAKGLTLQSKKNLTHHGIRLFQQNSTSMPTSALAIPLVPICFPRLVKASMGNILRQIASPENDSHSAPASRELESLVPLYHKSRGEPSQSISVWALVIPESVEQMVTHETRRLLELAHGKEGIAETSPTLDVWAALWKSDPIIWSELVPFAIEKGARLHRVLSGGGGWGKKAGLLSLDPAVTSTESESSTSQSFSDQLEGPGDLSSALSPVAQDGDSIQFLVSSKCPHNHTNDPDRNSEKLKQLTESSSLWDCELGTIPSTIDAVQANSWQHNASESKEVFVFRNSFGALTEGGMSFKRQFDLRLRDSLSVVGGTKVDVPFSRFCSVDFAVDKQNEESIFNQPTSKVSHSFDGDGMLSTKQYRNWAPSYFNLPRVKHLRLTEHTHFRKHPTQSPLSPLDLNDEPAAAPIHKVHVSSSSLYTPREEIPGLIRKYTITKPDPIYDMTYFKDRLRLTQKHVQRLTAEARILMATIRKDQQQRQSADFEPITSIRKISLILESDIIYFADCLNRTQDVVQSLYFKFQTLTKDIHDRHHRLRNLYADLIKHFAHQTDLSDGRLYELQKHLISVLYSTSYRVLALFDNKAISISASILALRNEFAQILHLIERRENLIYETNKSAIRIYHIHILLRWHLAALILKRQSQNHPASQIFPLERHLVHLRVFKKVLLVHYDDIQERHIRRKLDNLENSNLYLRSLRLSEAGQHMQDTLCWTAAERIKRMKNANLRLAIRKEPLGENSRIRKTLDKAPIRLMRRTEGPIYRRIIDVRGLVRTHESRGIIKMSFVSSRSRRPRRSRRSKGKRKRKNKRDLIETVSRWLGMGSVEKGSEEM